MRRVVITGLGAVTPLGASISRTWRGIIAGKSGLVATPDSEEYKAIPSRVAGLVPTESRQRFTEPVPKDETSESKAPLKDLLWNADEWASERTSGGWRSTLSTPSRLRIWPSLMQGGILRLGVLELRIRVSV
ncbi:hypothetical protein VE04_09523 [Pseudogymnoascus sp. 24MN13]|nr:hypothetical protein VE04_09523 [Pseudogymnoascus sp. 24MN13]